MKCRILRLVLVAAIVVTVLFSIPKSAFIDYSQQQELQNDALDVPRSNRAGYSENNNNSNTFSLSGVTTTNHDDSSTIHFIATASNNYTFMESAIVDINTTTNVTYNNNNNTLSICFITSVYAKWAAHADTLQKVTKWQDDFHFFVYTNLPNLPVKGWTRILKTTYDDGDIHNNNNNNNTSNHTTYNRFITQSRWPKFLAWKDPVLKQIQQPNCQVIFYLDSIGHLLGTPAQFREMAYDIYHSNVGLAQYKHKGGGGAFGEFRRIEVFQKDIPSNIQKSKDWLLQQPDFRPYNCTLYENRYFGYRTTSKAFQQASTFLWNRYSKEQDSWRDQPLWCYVLDHFNITPIELRHKDLFRISTRRMGKNKHRYDASAEGNAKKYK